MNRDGVDPDKRATLRSFAALGAATPLARLAEASGADDSQPRQAILGYISTTPGAHFSKLRDDLTLGTGETQHHVRRLLDEGRLEARRDGEYRRFYPAGEFSAREQVALGYLRRPTARGIIVHLLRSPQASGQELAAALDVSRPTISKQAADLADAGLLDREDGYQLVEPETLLVLLVRYAESFDRDAVVLAGEAADLVRLDR